MVPQRTAGTPKSLADALTLIRNHDAELGREVVSAVDLRFEEDCLRTQDRTLRLSPASLERLCHLLGAPACYVRRLPSGLRSELLSYHLLAGDLMARGLRWQRRRPTGNMTVLARQGTLVGFARPDLTTLCATDVLERIAGAGERVLKDKFDNLIPQRLELRDEAFELDLRSPEIAIEAQPGDVVQAGVRISHSLVDEYPTRIQTFLLRLFCSNGAVLRECIGDSARRIRRTIAANREGASQTLWRIEQLACDVFMNLEPKLTALTALVSRSFENEVQVRRFIEANLRAAPRLHSRRLVRRVEEAWRDQGRERSEYAVWNAFTSVATHTPAEQLRPTVRTALERLGGILATRSWHCCPYCYRVLGEGS